MQVCRLQSGAWTLLQWLSPSLHLSSSSQFSLTQSFWLPFLSQSWTVFFSALSVFLFSLCCRSFTSFCTGLWAWPAMAVLLQGTADMHELLHCYEFTNGSLSSKCLASVCSASPATWQCWTHAPSMLWPGLPKEPQANSTFYHFCSFCTSYGGLYCAEGFEWSHVCLEYLFFFWVKLILLLWNHILIIQVHQCGLSLQQMLAGDSW